MIVAHTKMLGKKFEGEGPEVWKSLATVLPPLPRGPAHAYEQNPRVPNRGCRGKLGSAFLTVCVVCICVGVCLKNYG